jgi:hypothetical protein
MLNKNELAFWAGQNSYTLLEASYLIHDESPANQYIKTSNKTNPFPSDIYDLNISPQVLKTFSGLFTKIKKGELPLSQISVDAISGIKPPVTFPVVFKMADTFLEQGRLVDVSELFRLDRDCLKSLFSRNDKQPKPAFLFVLNEPEPCENASVEKYEIRKLSTGDVIIKFEGEESIVSGVAAGFILKVIGNQGKELPYMFFSEGDTVDSTEYAESISSDYESNTYKKTEWQKMYTTCQDELEDAIERCDEDEIEKKKTEMLKFKSSLRESNGSIGENGKVIMRRRTLKAEVLKFVNTIKGWSQKFFKQLKGKKTTSHFKMWLTVGEKTSYIPNPEIPWKIS